MMETISAAFESSAFSVVGQNCATSKFSFAHELGHNQGADHDAANAGGGGTPPFNYCFGLQVPTATPAYRTIMAYECAGTPCPRVNNWSNPGVTQNGKPTGTATANNAKCLDMTRATAGAWR